MFQTSETQKCTLANVKRRKKSQFFSKQKNLSAFNLKGTLFVLPKFEEKTCQFSFSILFSLILIFLHSFSLFARFLHLMQKPICHSFPYQNLLCFAVILNLFMLPSVANFVSFKNESSISFQVSKYTAHSLTNNSSKHLK